MKRLLIAALVAVFSLPAYGQTTCWPGSQVEQILRDKYGEHPVAHGIMNDGSLLEEWGNEETGTVTIFVRLPDGSVCPLAAAESWEPVIPKQPSL